MTGSATTSTASRHRSANAVEVLHFDEAWYAYANFHEFYDGYHAISSREAATVAARDHLRHAVDAQAARGAVAGLDDPCAARRTAASGHDALQRRVHDAHVDVAAIRHHRVLRCGGCHDGAARGPRDRAGNDRRGLSFRRAMTAVKKTSRRAGGLRSGSLTGCCQAAGSGRSALGL